MDHVKTGKAEKPLDRSRTNMIRDVDEFLNTPVRKYFILATTFGDPVYKLFFFLTLVGGERFIMTPLNATRSPLPYAFAEAFF